MGPDIPSTDEGYLLVAIGSEKYLDLALSCARSLAYNDPARAVQLLTDFPDHEKVRGCHALTFVDRFEHTPGYPATLSKLIIHGQTRFDRTMFVDADCFLLKGGISIHWDNLKEYSFAIPGGIRKSGSWYQTDIATLLQNVGQEYLVQINSGVIYFDKSDKAQATFSKARENLEKYAHFIRAMHGTGAHGDEPFFGLAMAALGLKIYPQSHPKCGELMMSTISSSDFHFDPEQKKASFRKSGNVVSPHIVHFVNLSPQAEYATLSKFFSTVMAND